MTHLHSPKATDWDLLVTTLSQVVAAVDAADPDLTQAVRPDPSFPATFVEINTVEANLGYRLPLDYQGLLIAAGGWERMCEDLSLLSPGDLLEGGLHDRAVEVFCLLNPSHLGEYGLDWEDLLPIAASTSTTDVAALVVTGVHTGRVVWSTETGLVIFESTREWLRAMIEETRQVLRAVTPAAVPEVAGVTGDSTSAVSKHLPAPREQGPLAA